MPKVSKSNRHSRMSKMPARFEKTLLLPSPLRNRPKKAKPSSKTILRVHGRFVDDEGKPFWRVSMIKAGQKPEEANPNWVVRIDEDEAKRVVASQKRRGEDDPVYSIAYLGPRICFNGPPGPGRPVQRWVHWVGFPEPTLMVEADIDGLQT